MSDFRRAHQAIAHEGPGKAPRPDSAGADPLGDVAAILGPPTASHAAPRPFEAARQEDDRPAR